jgi:isochorismate synthase
MNNSVAFAAFRLPDSHELHLWVQNDGEVETFSSPIKQEGFLLIPFYEKKDNPSIIIRADIKYQGDKDVMRKLENLTKDLPLHDDVGRRTPNYHESFKLFSHALNTNILKKIVLSHTDRYNLPKDFSPVMAFHKACKKYSRTMVYFCYTPQTGLWLGCTPEILLSGNNNYWHTIALAGTMSLKNGRLPYSWNPKDIKEQSLVSDYINDCLLHFSINPQRKGPYPKRAGQLAHLRTDFSFPLNRETVLLKLLNALHPTPAICGLPKKESFHFIIKYEGYNRRYYSGIVGPLTQNSTQLFVNLRCMEIFKSCVWLYAGGGLLKESIEENEYAEIMKKMETTKSLLL